LADIKKFRPDKLTETSTGLYRILIEPVKRYLAGKEKLLIIPDKNLLYLPYETLINTETGTNEQSAGSMPHYLIRDFEISYHYSAVLWMEIQSGEPNQNKGFLGFAPVFSNAEMLTSGSGSTEKLLRSINDTNLRTSFSADGRTINELPYTKKEVQTISDLFRNKDLKAESYLMEQATESNLKALCGNFSFIHLATHGLIYPDKPDLSGLIFTGVAANNSAGINERGEPQIMMYENIDDGVLFTHEIFNLKMNAELVVLSACETGIGKLEEGEGVMSLNRAFLYAGARNIVSSFWKVNDKYTSELMTWFYTYIIEGCSYSKALQQAKLRLLENESSAYPLYWAGFAIIGE
jgi:CHAT domain-containing protein